MFPYIPHTAEDIAFMLKVLGLESIDALFSDIPDDVKYKGRLNLCAPLSENEIDARLSDLSKQNIATDHLVCFMGGGAYDHSIPSVIKHLIDRSEFNTAYTPYQPEISQGTLQAIFEYQTMIAGLTDMDMANASMYDGASATAEAAMLAAANQKGSELIISETVHPETIEVVKTYMRFRSVTVKVISAKDGVTDKAVLKASISPETVGVIVQSPNYFGNIEDLSGIADWAHENKALFIVNSDPISLAILKTPGIYGADIAVGEGQTLGNGLNYGGPYLGYMAATTKQMRKLPGRIVGQTEDLDGKRAYTLTLQAREQHIRREKATSNICSNQALNALTATIYLTVMGKIGLKKIAEETARRAYYGYQKLIATGHFKPVYQQPFFREFVLETTKPVSEINDYLAGNGILGGIDVSIEGSHRIMFSITEKRTIAEIDHLVKTLEVFTW